MFERILALGRQGARVDEVEVFELQEGGVEATFEVRHGAQELMAEDAPENGRDLEEATQVGVEAVDP